MRTAVLIVQQPWSVVLWSLHTGCSGKHNRVVNWIHKGAFPVSLSSTPGLLESTSQKRSSAPTYRCFHPIGGSHARMNPNPSCIQGRDELALSRKNEENITSTRLSDHSDLYRISSHGADAVNEQEFERDCEKILQTMWVSSTNRRQQGDRMIDQNAGTRPRPSPWPAAATPNAFHPS